MPTQQLSYLGINRAVSDYSPSRACEELINLRPTTDGLVPVKPVDRKWTGLTYDKLYVHNAAGGQRNYIAVLKGTTTLKIYRIFDNGTSPVQIGDDITVAAGLSVDDVHFASAGNIFLVSICGAGTYENRAFIWKNGAYQGIDGHVPNILVNVTQSSSAQMVKSSIALESLTDNRDVMADIVAARINELQEEHPELCFGPIIIAIAFRTTDGSTFWTGKWEVYDPISLIDTTIFTPPYRVTAQELPFAYLTPFFEEYGYGYEVVGRSRTESALDVTLAGAGVTLVLPKLTAGSWDEDSSIVKSVEVYVSRPVLYGDLSNLAKGTDIGLAYYSVMPPLPYNRMGLENQLLYLQASIPLADLAQAQQTVTLTFGGNIQLTNDTLEVDAGMVERFGKILSYNARFHYYDSVSRTSFEKPALHFNSHTAWWGHVFVLYDDGQKLRTIYCGGQMISSSDDAYLVMAPSIKIKEVITYYYSVGQSYVRKYRMTASSTYNYAINTSGSYAPTAAISGAIAEYESLITQTPDRSVLEEEPNAINVTEQYSPFVFRVEHSYLAPGAILDLQPQMVVSSDVEVGTYPLNVFTTRGVYALMQGSSNVLYGAMRALSNLVTGGNCVPTEAGTFMLASGKLWAVSGVHTTLVSDALSLGPHAYLRSCVSYQAISGGPAAPNEPQYDVSTYVSQVPFEQFVGGAHLSYNRWRDELVISNPSYAYSYVLSLKYRQWFKISQSFRQDTVGGNIAIAQTTGGMDVYDFSEEATGTVLAHLQSRPFSIGYQYSRVHRLVAMLRAAIKHTEKVIVALYGSDDLQGWTLISYAYRSGSTQTVDEQTVDVPLRVSQVRTAPAGRSWRYYTVCIGGYIPTDTDLGPVLLDYQGVVRRIG